MSFLFLSSVTKQLNDTPVIKNISFTQQQFQKIAIAGETGAGKTTLLKIIAGLIQTDTGELMFDDQKILGPDDKLIPGHKGIAYISQNFELRNNYRVEEELAYTNELTGEAAADIFKVCDIDHLLKRWTDELSGGEKQRIVTARALIASPKLLLLDEPFSNLDMAHKQIMKTVIAGITEKLKITCILVSHDPLDTLSWADEIIILRNGELIQQGTPAQVYLQPVNEYAAALFGKYNLLNAAAAGLFSTLPGLPEKEKKIMLRPEHFRMNEKQVAGSLKGIVKKITFYGSYFDLDVLVEEILIVVRTVSCNVVENNIVYISMNVNAFWYV